MLAAKAHWGYDPAWVRAWVDGGAFSPGGAPGAEVLVAEQSSEVVGWAQLVLRPADGVGWLEDLWIAPAAMHAGIGTALFRRCVRRCRELGLPCLEWEADPHSVAFYERLGGRHVRDGATDVWGRTPPIMRLDLHGRS